MNITECDKDDVKIIVDGLIKFNAEQVPFSQSDPFINLNYKIEEIWYIKFINNQTCKQQSTKSL